MEPTGPITTSQKINAIFGAVPPVNGNAGERASARQSHVRERDPRPGEQEARKAGPGGVYIISVAARILSMHPQTLRKYERVGLVRPSRTVGMLRLYSDEDIAKLRTIKYLVDELRLNLAGVEMALAVFDRLISARSQIAGPGVPSPRVFEQIMEDILALLQGRQAQSGSFGSVRGERV